jgi:erythronate-4-phosphate dehydrogenase
MKIVADPNIPFVREAFSALGEIQFVAGRQINASAVRDADMLLVRSVTAVNAALLDDSNVKFVATATIGTDHVDPAYLRAHGIGFASAAGSNANSVAEYVVAAMLEISHRNHYRLRDKTLGVVGVGNVGRRVVHYAEALGMRVLQNDPPRQRAEVGRDRRARREGDGQPGGLPVPHFVSLDRVCAEADIVTLHVPLTREGEDATYHLFDDARLAALKRRPTLINTARGAVVDNSALLHAFHHRNWKVSDAVLDVWENEPDISTELLNLVDIGTPHIAGYSFDGKANGTLVIYRAACEFLGIGAGGPAPSTGQTLEGAAPAAPLWAPQLPPPPVPRLEVVVENGEDDEEVLRRVIRQVYDITADDAALRERHKEFDRLRAEYPVRREFFNTELTPRGASEGLRTKFAALGFRLA